MFFELRNRTIFRFCTYGTLKFVSVNLYPYFVPSGAILTIQILNFKIKTVPAGLNVGRNIIKQLIKSAVGTKHFYKFIIPKSI